MPQILAPALASDRLQVNSRNPCAKPAGRAKALSNRAKGLRRKATRFAKGARRQSNHAKRCRRACRPGGAAS